MKFRIHFDKQGFQDFYEITGNTIEDIKNKNDKEMLKRGLDSKLNNCWSEERK